ncbi:hypothetical protein V2J09_010399 [Rumex salicifolius]
MATCAPKSQNSHCVSCRTVTTFRPAFCSPLLLRSSHSRLFPTFKLRLISAIKEKESISTRGNGKASKNTVNGTPVDELPKPSHSPAASDEDQFDRGKGFELNWPPWKDLPLRYKLVGTTSLAFVICNMDKVNLSIAIIPMSHQYGWNSTVAGLVQSSFFWGYALSQLPGGWLSKIIGGRQVLATGVLVWSLATALVPSLAGFMPGLILARVLVGIGEGVSPSAATDLIARHVHTIGGALTSSCLCFWRIECWKCCWASLSTSPDSEFWLGISVLHIWTRRSSMLVEEGQTALAASDKTDLGSISQDKSSFGSLEELRSSLKDVPWKAFFQTPAVWAMIYAHFCGSWGHYTCLSWLPTYFSEELDLNLTEAAWVSVLPPLASIVVTSVAAQLADNLISRGVETTTVRKICQTIAFVSPALCMTLSSVDLGLPPWEVVGLLTGGLALSSFALSGLYCTHQDMSPEYASILLGITNTVGAVPGIIGIALTGYLLDSTHSWGMSLFAPSIFFYLTGTIVWLAFASSKPQKFSKPE